jgi:hypothetical protein
MKKRLISFIPFKRATISTSLTHEQIVDLFSNSISPKWNLLLGKPPKNIKKVQGTISKEGFSIRPTSYYQGGFTYLMGKFLPDTKGTKVEVYVTGILYFILPFIGMISLCSFVSSFFTREYSVIFISLFGIIASITGLFLEADALDWFLSELLEQYIV